MIMIINEDKRALLIDALQVSKNFTHNVFNIAIEEIKNADTVEEIMDAKCDLLTAIVDVMPLNVAACYFCLINFPECSRCGYAKKHGDCNRDNSTYDKIQTAKQRLRDELELYYYGESYDN